MLRGACIRPATTITAGVLAAACLGKVAPVSTAVQDAFNLTPFALGATISLVTLLAALAAAPAGIWLRGREPRWWLAIGLAVMAVSGAAMTISAPSVAALTCLRVSEGAGYLVIVVGGPFALLIDVRRSYQPVALALWGACTPSGLAISSAGGGLAGAVIGWRGWFAALAITCAALAATVWALARHAPAFRPQTQPPADLSNRAMFTQPLLLGCALAAVGLIAVVAVSLLPTYLSLHLAVKPAAAGAATSAVAAASIPGNAGAAIALRRGISPAALACAALLSPALAFAAFSPAIPVTITIAAASALVFTVGVATSATYAALPAAVRDPGHLPLANGILTQLASAGALVAPPAFAAITGLRRWDLVGYCTIPAAIAGVGSMALATFAGTRAARSRPG